MQLVSPEIVAEVCGLSWPLLCGGGILGGALWLGGWWSHRFWIVLGTTVSAGLIGLQHAAALHSHPLIAAPLLAIAAGILALHLVRLMTFGAGGITGLLLVHALAPSWEHPLPVFVVSGLLSLLLFRWFWMSLSALLGGLVLIYAALALLNLRGMLEAGPWSDQGTTLLNWSTGLLTAMGFAFQFLIDRRSRSTAEDDDDGEGGLLLSFSRFCRRAA